MKKTFFIVLCLVLTVSLFCSQSFAVTGNDFSWTGYLRTNSQFGDNGNKGEYLWTGFGFHPRLQENQYWEQYLTAKFNKDAKFVLCLAQDQTSFNYNGTWGSAIAVRESYLMMDNAMDVNGLTVWFGNRMYRGDYFQLFDSWPLDDLNILGGGIKFGKDVEKEFAFGTKKAMSYTGPSTFTDNLNGQRTMLINKLIFHIDENQCIKTNLEYHTVNNTQATDSVSGNIINVPTDSGYRIGVEHKYASKTGENYIMADYANGDIQSDDFFGTAPAPVTNATTLTGTTIALPGVNYYKNSQAFLFGIGGFQDFDKMGAHYGVIYYQQECDNQSIKGQQTIVAVRPLYYITGKSNVGAEFDYCTYGSKLSAADVDYFQVAPMIEYTLKGKLWGWPKFKAIFADTFYKDDVVKYGETLKQAYNISIGIELVW